ncbi:hypothetical protein L6164_027306 [Bauhinia variegata]|uniref:Uncharacterized protein n=1 Tax=Bauhinia variegata TaxID=167791 RepID=A0ACB9LTN9_BAUVA|nr:hypothetical protein L6164_027306 [Bauhinia variegata]
MFRKQLIIQTMEMEPFRFSNNTALCLSPDFILPEEKRPSLSCAPSMDSIPIIDLKDYVKGSDLLVQNVSRACEESGMFQVINHGVPQDICQKVMATLLQFFQLPSEERAQFFTEDHSEQVKIFNYYLKLDDQRKVTMWSETFSHPWHPTQGFTHLLPKYPPQYRYYISKISSI